MTIVWHLKSRDTHEKIEEKGKSDDDLAEVPAGKYL